MESLKNDFAKLKIARRLQEDFEDRLDVVSNISRRYLLITDKHTNYPLIELLDAMYYGYYPSCCRIVSTLKSCLDNILLERGIYENIVDKEEYKTSEDEEKVALRITQKFTYTLGKLEKNKGKYVNKDGEEAKETILLLLDNILKESNKERVQALKEREVKNYEEKVKKEKEKLEKFTLKRRKKRY